MTPVDAALSTEFTQSYGLPRPVVVDGLQSLGITGEIAPLNNIISQHEAEAVSARARLHPQSGKV